MAKAYTTVPPVLRSYMVGIDVTGESEVVTVMAKNVDEAVAQALAAKFGRGEDGKVETPPYPVLLSALEGNTPRRFCAAYRGRWYPREIPQEQPQTPAY